MPQHSDVVLSNTDGSSNKVELTLWKDSTTLPQGYSTAVIPFLPGRQPTDDANYQQVDPKIGMTWDASNWVNGFGQGREEKFGQSGRYGYSNGVLATFANELVLGYREISVDQILKNGRLNEDTSAWGDGTESATSISDGYEGKAGRVTVSQTNGTFTQNYLGTVAPLQGISITFTARAKRVSGTGSASLKITDSAGTSTSTTSASGAGWEALSVTRTVDAAATSLSFIMEFTTAADVFDIDEFAVVVFGGANFPARPQEFSSDLYVPCGRTILKWDITNEIWYPVYCNASYAVTDIEVFGNSIYAGLDTSAPFVYSSDGTSWSSVGGSGDSSYAKYFSKVRNANGDFALAKVRSNQVSLSVTPSSLTSWGAEIKVGEPNHPVTNAFSANDTLIVGKEDGLFVYDRVSNQFRDISPETNLFTAPENFQVAISRANEVFTAAGNRAFYRLPISNVSGTWEDISYLLKSASFLGFSGQVSAIAQDVSNIFLAVPADIASTTGAFPYTFPMTFPPSETQFIMALKYQKSVDGGPANYVAHTITSLKIDRIQQLARFETTNTSSLFAFGPYDSDEARITRIVFPLKHEHPGLVGNKNTRLSGDFYTSFMDFNFPDRSKTAVKMTLECLNVDADHPITVYYKIDGASNDDSSGWTQFGSAVTGSGSQTITGSLSNPVTFKRIRFRINMASNEFNSLPPRLQSVVFHSVFANVDFVEWQLQAKLIDARMTARRLRQVRDTQVLSTVLSDLETLRQEPFVLYTDLDGSTYRARITQKSLTPIGKNRSAMSGAAVERSYLLTLGLSEVKTT
jgi:hypothetical protein